MAPLLSVSLSFNLIICEMQIMFNNLLKWPPDLRLSLIYFYNSKNALTTVEMCSQKVPCIIKALGNLTWI